MRTVSNQETEIPVPGCGCGVAAEDRLRPRLSFEQMVRLGARPP